MPFGDLNDASYTVNNPDNDYGKILLMDFNGDPLDKGTFDTGYPNNLHLAYGNRNMFVLRRLPPGVDSQERFIWGENGNALQRACVLSMLKPDLQLNLQWTGKDDQAWLNMVDPFTGSEAVLFKGGDTSGVWVEPFEPSMPNVQQYLPTIFAGDGSGLVLHSYTQEKSGNALRSRTVNLEVVQNLNDAPQPAGFFIMRRLVWSESTYASAPLATAILPSGNFLVGDIFTGNLAYVKFIKEIPGDILTTDSTEVFLQLEKCQAQLLKYQILFGVFLGLFFSTLLFVIIREIKRKKTK